MKNTGFLLVLSLSLLLGCSKGGTGTGNPGITIASRGYNTALARNSLLDFILPSAVATSTSITSLKFCVSELRFVTSTGSTISVPESQLGLIDLGDGSQSVTWGKLVQAVPGTVITHVHVEIENENQLCSAGYTASANGHTITADLEFRFAMSTPYTVPSSGLVTFSLATLISKIDQAVQAGQFDNAHIGLYIDGSFEDSATGTNE